MARLLFTVWPYPTHLHPFIALAREARLHGHDVAFFTGGDALPVGVSAEFTQREWSAHRAGRVDQRAFLWNAWLLGAWWAANAN